MAYQDVLNAAAALGFALPEPQQQDAAQPLLNAQQAVADHKRLHELQQRLHALQLHVASSAVTDREQLQRRAGAVQAAADALRAVCASKDALADRLRSATTRPSVPVAPAYQPDFAALLQHSSSDQGFLQHGQDVLRWAADLESKPSCWEDRLRCILASAKDLGVAMAALEELSVQIQQLQ